MAIKRQFGEDLPRLLRRLILVGLLAAALAESIHPIDDPEAVWYGIVQFLGSLTGIGVIGLVFAYARLSTTPMPLVTRVAGAGLVLFLLEVALLLGIGLDRIGSILHADGTWAYFLHLIDLGKILLIILGFMFVAGAMQQALTDSELKAEDIKDELLRTIDADSALRALVESTAAQSGEAFFDTAVKRLSDVLGVRSAFIADYNPAQSGSEIQCRAFWKNGAPGHLFTIPTAGTLAFGVLRGEPVLYPDRVQKQFPEDTLLTELGAKSCMATPILSRENTVIGLIAVLHDEPLEPDPRREWILRIFAERAGTEMQRLADEARLREQAAIIDRTPDPILTLSTRGEILSWNPGAASLFGYSADEMVGREVSCLMPDESLPTFEIFREQAARGEAIRLWDVPRLRKDGSVVRVSISAFPVRDGDDRVTHYVSVIRDITREIEQDRVLRSAQEHLTFLAERSRDLVWTMGPDLVFDYANPAIETLTGFTVDEFVGRNLYEATTEEDANNAAALAAAAARGEIEEAIFEFHLNCRDGGTVLVETSAVVKRDADGGIAGFQGVSRNITERKEAEERLRASEERYRFLAEKAQDLVWVLDTQLKFTYVSPSIERLLGYTPEEWLGQDGHFTIIDEDRPKVQEIAREAQRGGIDQTNYEFRCKARDGRIVVMETVASTQRDADGTVIGFQGFSRDVTERRQAEAALRASEEQFRYLAESMKDIIWRTDASGNLVYASPSYETMLGYRPEEVLGKYGAFNAAEGEAKRIETALRDGFARNDSEVTIEYVAIHKNGRPVDIESVTVFLRNESGALAGFQGISRDITARRAMERSLREADAQYRRIVETSHEGIVISDSDHVIRFANQRMTEMFGCNLNDVIGKSIQEFVFEEDREDGIAQMKSLLASNVATFEFRYRRSDGNAVWTEVSAAVMRDLDGQSTGILSMITDVTERRAEQDRRRDLELQVQHAQRLESLGVLAGGIAHDFNNLLAGILGHASLLGQELKTDDPLQEYVHNIVSASNRAAELTKQMLAYSGRGRLATERVNLSALTREMAGLVGASIAKMAQLRLHLDDGLAPVDGDPGQLSQVLMNLIINASDALGNAPGTIDVRTANVEVTDDVLAQCIVRAEAAIAGRYAMFEVVDSGSGMDRDTRNRIFEPFFTTKFAGRGLGLSAVLGIVRRHGGALLVDSEVGQGTTMRVFLPSAESSEDGTLGNGQKKADPADVRLRGRALVVDDDPNVLSMTSKLLVRRGMDVDTATNGKEAVDAFAQNPKGYALIVLDLTMPVMNGADALAEIRSIRSDVPVVISSGYSDSDILASVGEQPNLSVIQKPYRIHDFVEIVCSVLAGTAPRKVSRRTR